MRHAPTTLAGLLLGLAVLLLPTACRCPSREKPPELEVTPLAELCPDEPVEETGFCLPAHELERALASGPLEVLDAHVTAQGATKPQRIRYRVPRAEGTPLVDYAKWKPAPESGDESNNTPRREIAAYRLQKLFLDEADYVVPPTVLRCLPLAEHASWLGEETKPWPSTACALGVLAAWLRDVEELGEIDAERFERDARYRRHVADLNVFTMLAGHRDSIGQNFMVAEDDDSGRAFCVDSGMTFGAWEYNPLRVVSSAWEDLRVPALRRETVERLRALDAQAFADALAVVAELRIAGDGSAEVATQGEPLDAEQGVRRAPGVLQLGLTRGELADLEQRRQALLARVDAGEIPLF